MIAMGNSLFFHFRTLVFGVVSNVMAFYMRCPLSSYLHLFHIASRRVLMFIVKKVTFQHIERYARKMWQ